MTVAVVAATAAAAELVAHGVASAEAPNASSPVEVYASVQLASEHSLLRLCLVDSDLVVQID